MMSGMSDWLDVFFPAYRACYVVAEIGGNHMGSEETAREMVWAALAAGADAVKFQMRDIGSLYTREFADAPYDGGMSFGATYGKHREALEIDLGGLRDFVRKCSDKKFIVTPFDLVSLERAEALEPDAYKISSGDLTNTELISAVAAKGRPVFISTGGGTMEDVDRAIRSTFEDRTVLYHCVSAYPAYAEDMNLKAISAMVQRYGSCIAENGVREKQIPIGLSDHTSGILMPIVAYMLGARVIEKHVTLDRSWKGRDQSFSIEPQDLFQLVGDLREASRALGIGKKQPQPSEREALYKIRKSLVAADDLPEGHVLRPEDMVAKSPGGGLEPYRKQELVGACLTAPLLRDALISFDVVA
jgi:sialic acid synthase